MKLKICFDLYPCLFGSHQCKERREDAECFNGTSRNTLPRVTDPRCRKKTYSLTMSLAEQVLLSISVTT